MTPHQAAPPRIPLALTVLALLFPVATFAEAIALVWALARGAAIGEAQVGLVVALALMLGATLALTCGVVNWFAGSSLGSWTKNFPAAPAAPGATGEASAPADPTEPASPADASSPPPPGAAGPAGPTLVLRGKVSHFGGPDDRGVKPDEGLALIEPNRLDDFPQLAALMLPAQPAGTTGLARRLDPAKAYIACRWDYARTPKPWLRGHQVTVRANGKSLPAQPIDWGPAASTGRVADLSPGLMAALGLKTDDVCDVIVPLPDETVQSAPPAPSELPGGPPWLARAIALRGLYERAGAADNPQILAMARLCGGKIAATYKHDDIPWCALFVNYCLVASGRAGNDSLWALDFTNYGRKLAGPAVGAIASKKRSGGGHVFFVRGRDSAGRIVGIGGNQADMVCDDEFDPEAMVAYTWPEDVPLPAQVGASKTDVSALPLVTAVPAARKDVELPA